MSQGACPIKLASGPYSQQLRGVTIHVHNYKVLVPDANGQPQVVQTGNAAVQNTQGVGLMGGGSNTGASPSSATSAASAASAASAWFSSTISSVSSKIGRYVEYDCQICCAGAEWEKSVRFSDIQRVFDILATRYNNLPTDLFPKKTIVRSVDPGFLEARKSGLNDFLKVVCQNRMDILRTCVDLWQLFDFDKHLPDLFCSRPPHLGRIFREAVPVESGNLSDAKFGIRDFYLEQKSDLLVLATNDFSWNTKVEMAVSTGWKMLSGALGSATGTLGAGNSSATIAEKPISSMVCYKGSDFGFDKMWSVDYNILICAFSANSECAFAGLKDGTVAWQKLAVSHGNDGLLATNILPMLKHTAPLSAVGCNNFASDYKLLFTGSTDGRFMVYDFEKMRTILELVIPLPTFFGGNNANLSGVSNMSNSSTSGTSDGSSRGHLVYATKMKVKKDKLYIGTNLASITVMHIRNGGQVQILCTVAGDAAASSFDAQNFLSKSPYSVRDIHICEDNQGGYEGADGEVRVFLAIKDGVQIWRFGNQSSNSHAYDPQFCGRQVGWQGSRGTGDASVKCVTFRKETGEILLGYDDGTMSSYDIDSGHQLSVWPAHSDEGVTACSFTLDYLLTSGKDKLLKIWRFPTGGDLGFAAQPTENVSNLDSLHNRSAVQQGFPANPNDPHTTSSNLQHVGDPPSFNPDRGNSLYPSLNMQDSYIGSNGR